MDQLHEELKEPVVELPNISPLSPVKQADFDGTRSDSGIPVSEESSQSDCDYETCESGASSEKDSCADEAIDNSDPSQEKSDILIPASSAFSSKQSNHCNYMPETHIEVISNHIEECAIGNCPPFNSEKQKCNTITPDCCSHASNTDSAIVNEINLTCDKSDCPLLKEDSKSSHQPSMVVDVTSSKDSKIVTCINEKHCNHTPVLASKHISTSKGTCRHINSIKHINSMLPTKKKPVQYRSVISDIFDGKILSSVQCLTCDTVSFFQHQ